MTEVLLLDNESIILLVKVKTALLCRSAPTSQGGEAVQGDDELKDEEELE